MSNTFKRSKKGALAVASATTLLAPLGSTMVAANANAADVDIVTNVTSDKSVYTAGKDNTVYTVTVQNRSSVDADTTSKLNFVSGLNGQFDANTWKISSVDSMNPNFKPTIVANDYQKGEESGFNTELPALKAGEKITFTITAPADAGAYSSKTNKVTATVTPSDDKDNEIASDTNTSSIAPQLIVLQGKYGISTTPLVNADDPTKAIDGNGKASYVVTLKNEGNVNENISFETKTDFSDYSFPKNTTVSCLENCSPDQVKTMQYAGENYGRFVPLQEKNKFTANETLDGIQAFVKAGEEVKILITLDLNTNCGKASTATTTSSISMASLPESNADNENNEATSRATITAPLCKVTDLAVDSITTDVKTETDGIKPWFFKSTKNGDMIYDNGAVTYTSKGSIASYDVTYSNKGTSDQYIQAGINGGYFNRAYPLAYNYNPSLIPELIFLQTSTSDNYKGDARYSTEKGVSVVQSTGGAEAGITTSGNGTSSLDSLTLPAGSSITIRYKFVAMMPDNYCTTRADGPLQANITPSAGNNDVNLANNTTNAHFTLQGVKVSTSCAPGVEYDATTSIEGVYTDPDFKNKVSGALTQGQKIYVRYRYTLTNDSSTGLSSASIKTNASYKDGIVDSNQTINSTNRKLIDSNNTNLKLDDSGELTGVWKAGDYAIVSEEYTVPVTPCKTDGTDDRNNINFISNIVGYPNEKASDMAPDNNDAKQTQVYTVPQCSGTLAIEKSAVDENVSKDGKGHYTIKMTNNGKTDLYIAQLADQLPKYTKKVTLDSTDVTGGAIAPDKDKFQIGKNIDENGVVTDIPSSQSDNMSLSWGSKDKPAIPAGASVTLHLTVEQSDGSEGQYNKATFNSDSDDPGNYRSVSDDAYISSNLGQNLSITKKISNPNPKPGEKVTYTVDLANYGNTVDDAYFRDTITAELLKSNPNGFTNIKCTPLTADDGVLSGDFKVGNATCPDFTSDASGITAHVQNMESNSGIRITYDAIAPSDSASAANIANFSSDPIVANIGDGMAQANLLVQTLKVSGAVWDDADNSAKETFDNIKTGDEKGTDATGLSVVLIDSAGMVVNTGAVNSDGTYSMDAPITTQGMKVALVSTEQAPSKGTIFDPKSGQLPIAWINTTPLSNTIDTEYKDITGLDFGIEQLPETATKTVDNQVNPGGNKQIQVPSLTGTDPEDGGKGTGDTFRIDTLPKDGVLYYDGKPVTEGEVIDNYDPTKLTVDPNSGNVTIQFNVSVQDKAGKWDPTPATVTMPFITNPSIISGYVYEDNNNDGAKGDAEKGIAGTEVTLTGTDEDGKDVKVTVKTNANGYYEFNVAPGTYKLDEAQPSSYLNGKTTAGSGATTNGKAGSNSITDIVVGDGQKVVNNNFGEVKPSSISGTVYEDKNKNGVQDADEKGIPGVTVHLTRDDTPGSEAPTALDAVTDADGNYSFKNLENGDYTIKEDQPSGYDDGKDSLGKGATGAGTLGNDVINKITLNSGDVATGYNFAEVKKDIVTPPVEVKAGSISGYVYDDVNKNGVKDSAEKGVAGVTVTLTGKTNDGKNINITIKTDANGKYTFDNLTPGSYTITERQPVNLIDGKDSLGSGATKLGDLSNDKISNIVIGSGDKAVNYNFGENVKDNTTPVVTPTKDGPKPVVTPTKDNPKPVITPSKTPVVTPTHHKIPVEVTGPKVQTDNVSNSSATDIAGALGLALMVGGALAGKRKYRTKK